MSRKCVRYYIKAKGHKAYIKEREIRSETGKKYAWTSNKNEAISWEDRERARSVARRYDGRVVTL